jgi:hypothetical protein
VRGKLAACWLGEEASILTEAFSLRFPAGLGGWSAWRVAFGKEEDRRGTAQEMSKAKGSSEEIRAVAHIPRTTSGALLYTDRVKGFIISSVDKEVPTIWKDVSTDVTRTRRVGRTRALVPQSMKLLSSQSGCAMLPQSHN